MPNFQTGDLCGLGLDQAVEKRLASRMRPMGPAQQVASLQLLEGLGQPEASLETCDGHGGVEVTSRQRARYEKCKPLTRKDFYS